MKGGTNERTNGQTDELTNGRTNESPPVFYRTSSSSGPLPKKGTKGHGDERPYEKGEMGTR